MSSPDMERDGHRDDLGLRPGLRVWIGGHDLGSRRSVEVHLAHTVRPPTGAIDAAFVCADSADEAIYFAAKHRARLVADGKIWIVTTTASSAHPAQLNWTIDAVIPALRELGYVSCGNAEVGPHAIGWGFRLLPVSVDPMP